MSIRQEVISRLLNHRALTSQETAELDNIAIAAALHDNDPMWGMIGWAWATMPRRTDFDTAAQAISDKIAAANDERGAGVDLTEIHKKLDDLTSRPTHEIPVAMAPAQIDEAMLRRVVVAAMPAAGAGGAQIDFIRQFKDAVIEGVSWVWVVIAGLVLAAALLGGYVVGTRLQERDNAAQIQLLQGQVSTLTAVVALTMTLGDDELDLIGCEGRVQLVLGLDPKSPDHGRGQPFHQPDHGPQGSADEQQSRRQQQSRLLRAGDGEVLGNHLADHDVQVGDDEQGEG